MYFFPRTNFLANRSPVRGGVRANSAELRRTFAGVRRSVGVGEPMANSRGVRTSSLEFARVCGERQFAGYTAETRHSIFVRKRSAKVDTAFSHEDAVLRSGTAFSYENAVLRPDTAFSREIAVMRSSLHFSTKMLCRGLTQRFCTTQHSYCNISCTKRAEGQPWGGGPQKNCLSTDPR